VTVKQYSCTHFGCLLPCTCKDVAHTYCISGIFDYIVLWYVLRRCTVGFWFMQCFWYVHVLTVA